MVPSIDKWSDDKLVEQHNHCMAQYHRYNNLVYYDHAVMYLKCASTYWKEIRTRGLMQVYKDLDK